jgi:hypothetical protein
VYTLTTGIENLYASVRALQTWPRSPPSIDQPHSPVSEVGRNVAIAKSPGLTSPSEPNSGDSFSDEALQ